MQSAGPCERRGAHKNACGVNLCQPPGSCISVGAEDKPWAVTGPRWWVPWGWVELQGETGKGVSAFCLIGRLSLAPKILFTCPFWTNSLSPHISAQNLHMHCGFPFITRAWKARGIHGWENWWRSRAWTLGVASPLEGWARPLAASDLTCHRKHLVSASSYSAKRSWRNNSSKLGLDTR